MQRYAIAACAALFIFEGLPAGHGLPPLALNSTFENSSGPTLDSTFGVGPNWTGTFEGLPPHSGPQFFESDNGNQATDFVNERYAKQLGGVIANRPYDVAFYIAANKLDDDMQGMTIADFAALAIGGSGGSMTWQSTPPPVPGAGWTQWRGRYTPSSADVGRPFQFRMIVTIPRRHSLAIDGPMTAVAVPEPAVAALASVPLLIAGAVARGRVRRGGMRNFEIRL